MQQISQTKNSVTYALPAALMCWPSRRTRPCYVVVRSLMNKTNLFATTISAGVTQSVLVPGGSTSLEAYAGGSSLSVRLKAGQSELSPCSATPSSTTSTRLVREPQPARRRAQTGTSRANNASGPAGQRLGTMAGEQPGLVKVIERVLGEADPTPEAFAVDLGCGSGQVTLALARRCRTVLGVDVSREMIHLLLQNAAREGISNVKGRAVPIERLGLAQNSVDLVVSNYALHHLRDRDKQVAVNEACKWLRPGGKLVIGDMMFGRGGDPRDREIIGSKLNLLLRKGPGGWWRIVRTAVATCSASRSGPYPCPPGRRCSIGQASPMSRRSRS